MSEALRFAQDELAPRGEENPELLVELERTMALLAFDTVVSPPGAIGDLLSPAQRLKTAGEVNAAVLESLSQGKEAKLVELLKLLCWGDSLLEEKADFPKVRVAPSWKHGLNVFPAQRAGGDARGEIVNLGYLDNK